jgi:hypothetical protein
MRDSGAGRSRPMIVTATPPAIHIPARRRLRNNSTIPTNATINPE